MENEIRLERFQESIHCYYRIELKECGYFEDVEYRMFCHNCLSSNPSEGEGWQKMGIVQNRRQDFSGGEKQTE